MAIFSVSPQRTTSLIGDIKLNLFILFISLFLSACSQLSVVKTAQVFADTGFQTINTLDVYAESNSIHVLLSGQEKTSQQLVLRYINSLDAGKTWSIPVRVNQNISSVKQSKRGNDFQVAAHDDNVMAVWQTKGGEPWVGKISAALSLDGGKTWKAIPSPISDKYSNIDQGYFDIAADHQGNFHLTWLDDREEVGDTQVLRYANYQNNGMDSQWVYHNDLEAASCTCCWSRITTDKKGNVHVLYRDDSPRDMMLTSSFNAGESWDKPETVWPFNWEFVGCPHQGGGIATTQLKNKTIIHSVVWNGKDENQGLYYHQSLDTKETLLPNVTLGDETSTSGDVATIDNNRIGTVYTTGIVENKSVMAKLSDDSGQSWQKELRLTGEGAEPSHPRVVGTSKGFRFFWTEWQENGDAIVVMSELEN